jgi:hypothetical protein
MGGRRLRGGGAQTLLQRFSALQRVKRLTRHLEKPDRRRSGTWTGVLKPDYQPHRLSRRLSDDTIAAILAMCHAGATTHEVGERFDLAHSSINKLLQQQGVAARRPSPSPTEVQRAVKLYEAALSLRTMTAPRAPGGLAMDPDRVRTAGARRGQPGVSFDPVPLTDSNDAPGAD